MRLTTTTPVLHIITNRRYYTVTLSNFSLAAVKIDNGTRNQCFSPSLTVAATTRRTIRRGVLVLSSVYGCALSTTAHRHEGLFVYNYYYYWQ